MLTVKFIDFLDKIVYDHYFPSDNFHRSYGISLSFLFGLKVFARVFLIFFISYMKEYAECCVQFTRTTNFIRDLVDVQAKEMKMCSIARNSRSQCVITLKACSFFKLLHLNIDYSSR